MIVGGSNHHFSIVEIVYNAETDDNGNQQPINNNHYPRRWMIEVYKF